MTLSSNPKFKVSIKVANLWNDTKIKTAWVSSLRFQFEEESLRIFVIS